jgi:hypothetical protein
VAAKSAKKPAKSAKSAPKTPAKKAPAKAKATASAAKPSKAASGLAALKNLIGGKKAEKKVAAPQAEPAPTDKKGMKSAKATPAAPAPKGKEKLVGAAPKTAATPRTPRIVQDNSCREVACESLATTSGYCRLHYIKNWKKIKRKELILKEGKLNQYIEELVAKYPDKYIEAIRMDLSSDKEFSKVVSDLELDEGVEDFNEEGESIENLIDSIRADVVDDDTGGGEGY